MKIKFDEVALRNITNPELRDLAKQADQLGNKDGILTPEEAQKLLETQAPNVPAELFDKALIDSMQTRIKDIGFGSGIPIGLGVLSRMARMNPLWNVGFQAVGSGSKNLNAFDEGRISGTRAVTETVADTAIAGSAAAAGAFIGAAAGSVVPVAGTVVGLMIGTGAGYLIDKLLHKAVDPVIDGVLQDL